MEKIEATSCLRCCLYFNKPSGFIHEKSDVPHCSTPFYNALQWEMARRNDVIKPAIVDTLENRESQLYGLLTAPSEPEECIDRDFLHSAGVGEKYIPASPQ